MSFTDPAFDKPNPYGPDALQYAMEGPPKKKKRGCLFYGCLVMVILAVLMAMAIFVGVRWLSSLANQYTATAPDSFPAVNMSDDARAALQKRVDEFTAAVKERKPTEPLELTSDEINALIESNKDLRGKVHVELQGSEAKGQISIPLDAMRLKGRYLNGSAEARVKLEDGRLTVFMDKVTVKGEPLPESFMQSLRQENLAKDFTRNPENAAMLEKLESIEIKDGKMIVKARPLTETPSDEKAQGSPPKDGAGSEVEKKGSSD